MHIYVNSAHICYKGLDSLLYLCCMKTSSVVLKPGCNKKVYLNLLYLKKNPLSPNPSLNIKSLNCNKKVF